MTGLAFMPIAQGHSEGFFHRPMATVYSPVKRVYGHFSLDSPVRETLGASVKCQQYVRAFVPQLLATRGPSAILWSVVIFIVDAIKRMRRGRTLTHVGVEGFKRIPPSIAHADASPAVVLECSVCRIVTTAFCARPGPMFRRVCHAVSEFQKMSRFTKLTPARFGIPLPHGIKGRNRGVSAVTSESKSPKLSDLNDFIDYDQSAIAFSSDDVQSWWHRRQYITRMYTETGI